MAVENSIDLDQDPRSIIGSRVLDAPRALVFSVWTDPKHLAQWWGPNGFTTTTHSYDFRPGGVWRFVMHGPDGRDYQNRITYDEIIPPERIVYRHGGGDDVEPVQFTQTVTFEDLGNGQTRLAWHGKFTSAEERTRVIREYGADKGLVQTMARLADYVVTISTEKSVQMVRRSRQRTQGAAQIIRMEIRHQLVDRSVRFSPKRKSLSEQRAPGCRDCQTMAALILLVDRNLYQPAAFKGFEGSGQRGAVHGKQRRDAADGRRFRPVQRHQQRKLTMRKIERTEHIVKASRQPTRRALHVQAQTVVAHQMGGGEW